MSGAWAIHTGDVAALLRSYHDEHFSFAIGDPPYALGREPTVDELIAYLQGASLKLGDFMGAAWELPPIGLWRELFRVLKPGAHVAMFGGTRTFDLISLGLRAAGFEYRDTIAWCYATGFPKSHNVSKAIDAAAGAEREVVGTRKLQGKARVLKGGNYSGGYDGREPTETIDITAPATDAAKKWSGYGTALKPSFEPILIFRKPLVGTVADNVLRHGTGAINIDACRISTDWSDRSESWKRSGHSAQPDADKIAAPPGTGINCHAQGRWPANIAFGHASQCREAGTRTVKSSTLLTTHALSESENVAMSGKNYARNPRRDYAPDGSESVAAWECLAVCNCGASVVAPSGGAAPRCECGQAMAWACPVAELDRQSGNRPSGSRVEGVRKGVGYGSSATGDGGPAIKASVGGASRFFFCAKPSRAERDAGLEGRNDHTTVKPLELAKMLARMFGVPGGRGCVPFAGSGTEVAGIAAEGFDVDGFEIDPAHADKARKRVAYWCGLPPDAKIQRPAPTPQNDGAPVVKPQLDLFGRAS